MSSVVSSSNDSNVVELAGSAENAFETYFKMHQRINAKNEETSKTYKNNLIINFSDIRELHQKTMQSIASLNPAGSPVGVRIAIAHNEGEVDKFNSFEAFESHNISSPNPTASVNLTYTFSLYDVETKQFENYKVLNQVRSRVVEQKKIEAEAPAFVSRALISGLVTTTARISIEYSDYVKARHFTAMFDEWIRGCDESKSSRFINGLKPYSHHITHFGRLIIYILLSYFTISNIDVPGMTIEQAIKFLVAYSAVFVVIGGVATVLLSKLEYSIDSYLALSYLNLNKGDLKIKYDYEERNRKSIYAGVFSILGALVLGGFTNGVYDLIKWILLKS